MTAQIGQSISAGDELAYQGLFKSDYADLVIYAMRFVQDMENAEEIVQDTFFNLWENRERLKVNVSLKSYLYREIAEKLNLSVKTVENQMGKALSLNNSCVFSLLELRRRSLKLYAYTAKGSQRKVQQRKNAP